LQFPFYSQDAAPELNFGGIGMVIGHEFTHGFDNNGRQYDADGSWRNWWTDKAQTQFEQRASCMVDQYSAFKLYPDASVNGTLTLPENIADNGGIHIAFDAFQTYAKENNIDVNTPVSSQSTPSSPNLSPNQRFFLAFSQLWCYVGTEKANRFYLKYNSHAPGMFRVLGTLQNFEPFSTSFNCKVGSKMNPTNKCLVW
jgi:putative endopeptidase